MVICVDVGVFWELVFANFVKDGGRVEYDNVSGLLISLVIGSALFYMLAIHVVKTVLPYIAENVGAAGVFIARILYVGFLAFTVLSPVAGYISDRVGYRRTIVVAAISESLLIYFYVFVRSYAELLVVRVLQAFLGVILSASFLHLASKYAERTGVYIGILRAAQAFGMALGPLLVFVLPTCTLGEFLEIAALLCLAPLSVILLEEPKTLRQEYGNIKLKVIKFVMRKELIPLYLCTISEIFAASIVFSYIVVNAIELFNLSQRAYGFILFVVLSTFGISNIFASKIADSHPIESAIIGVYMIAVSTYLITISKTLETFLISIIIFEITSALAYNPLYVQVSKILPDEIKGIGINSVDAIINLTFVTLPILEIVAKNYGLNATLIPATLLSLLAGTYVTIKYSTRKTKEK